MVCGLNWMALNIHVKGSFHIGLGSWRAEGGRRTGIGADKTIELNDYRGSYADEEGLQLGIKMFSLRSFLVGRCRWEMEKFEHKSEASKIKN